LPPVYSGAARYAREAPGTESWDTWDRVVARGYGDCEDLAAARVAELRYKKIDPRARVELLRTGARMLHAVVRRGDGKIEDPSKRLGMGGPSDRIELGAGPAPGQVLMRMERVPGGWVTRVQPHGNPPVIAQAKDATFAPAYAHLPKKVAKKKAKKKSKNAALRFLRKTAGAALRAALPMVANLVPGGALAANLAAAVLK
jgi:hypothetical protein